MSIQDWLRLSRLPGNEIMLNTMCRFLSGVFIWDEINPRTAARAKETLCRMPAFGITERFDESILLIGKALKLRHLFVIPTNMKTREVGALTIPSLQHQEMFIYDLQLYDLALELMQDRIDRLGPIFVEALAAYRETVERLRVEFAYLTDSTMGYEQPAELIARLRQVRQPAPIAALLSH